MADRFFVDGGIDNNWGTSGNWSASSGGAGGETVPTSSDDVFLDVNSPNCTLNSSSRNCLSLNCTGYTNTLTFDQILTVGAGNITFGAGMSFAGASALLKSTSGTITSNGVAVTIAMTLTGNVTFTLADDLNMDGALILGGSLNQTWNGNTLKVGGDLTTPGLPSAIIGTTAILFDGTGTWAGGGPLRTSGGVTINTAGTLTLFSSISIGVSLTYIAGTVVTTGSLLRTANVATTFAISGITLNNFAIGNSSITFNSTATLTEDINVGGTFFFNASTSSAINGNKIFVGGDLDGTVSSGVVAGSTEIVMVGTGALDWAGHLHNPLTIDTSGTITFVGVLSYNGGPLTYTTGTVLWSAATLVVQTHTTSVATTTFNLNGLVVDANLTLLRTGATAINLTLASDMEIAAGNTVTLTGESGQLAALLSNSVGVQRKFTLQEGVTVTARFTNATDIDSSDGRDVPYFKGTMTNTLNWVDTTNVGRKDKSKGGSGKNMSYALCAQSHAIGNPGITVG